MPFNTFNNTSKTRSGKTFKGEPRPKRTRKPPKQTPIKANTETNPDRSGNRKCAFLSDQDLYNHCVGRLSPHHYRPQHLHRFIATFLTRLFDWSKAKFPSLKYCLKSASSEAMTSSLFDGVELLTEREVITLAYPIVVGCFTM
jgi:hypothetical protein